VTEEDKNLVIPNAERIPLDVDLLGRSPRPTIAGDLLLSVDSPEDDYHPDITKDAAGNLVVTWTHKKDPLVATSFLLYSTDLGATWDGLELPLEGFLMYPQVAYMQGSKYIDTTWDGIWYEVLDVATEAGYFILIPDITDETTWEAYGWREGSRPGATYLNLEDDMWYSQVAFDLIHGPLPAMINDDQGMDQGIMVWWIAADLSGIVINWDSGTGPLGDYFPAAHIDMAPIHDDDPAQTVDDFFYLVCHNPDWETGKNKIHYKRCVPEIESDIEFVPEQLYLDGGEYDTQCPEVEASGDNVAVIYMTNENGDWDVKCSYSSDRGQTWATSMVANDPGVDETYPSFYMKGTNVYCGYIKEGNFYLVESNDGGATWGPPTQINSNPGSVVSEENSIIVHPAGLLWTDNRNGDKDIYFAGVAAAPIIGIKSISGGFGVSAVIENTGNADATNVQWSIELEGGIIILGKKTTGTIPTLAAGESVTIKSSFIFGIGKTTVVVTADDAKKSAPATVVLFLVLGL
jgi:hypothetical protein